MYLFQIGNILVLGAGGFLCEWPRPYYITGVVSVLFCNLWWFLIFDSPADHPRIKQREKILIENSNKSTKAQDKVTT